LARSSGRYGARCGARGLRLRFRFVIVDDDFEQLRLLMWNRERAEITEEEALALYEANRQWVDPASMSEREKRFFDDLVARYGRGVFHG